MSGLEGITMSELEIYQKQGFGNSSGIGQRPALLIVDFVNGFANPDQFGGGNIGEAIENTRGLLAEARALGLSIAFTRVVYADDGSDAGVFTLKAPTLTQLTEGPSAARLWTSEALGQGIHRAKDPALGLLRHQLDGLVRQQGRGHGDNSRMHHLRVRQGVGDRLDELQLQDRGRFRLRR